MIEQLTIPAIQRTVAQHFGVTVDGLKAPTKRRDYAVPRQVAMFLAREMTGASMTAIGDAFGGRDHTTVMHAHKAISRRMEADMDFESDVDACQIEAMRDKPRFYRHASFERGETK